MTPEQLERMIYDTFIDGYFATPALEQSYRIRARLAADDLMPAIEAHINTEVSRRLSRAIDTLEGRTARTVRVMPRLEDRQAG